MISVQRTIKNSMAVYSRAISMCFPSVSIIASYKGLILYGPTGLGKTRTAWQIVRRAITEHQRSVIFLKDTEFGRQIERSYDTTYGHDKLLRRLSTVDLLIIDDMGKAKMTERLEADLFMILDARTDHNPTVITIRHQLYLTQSLSLSRDGRCVS